MSKKIIKKATKKVTKKSKKAAPKRKVAGPKVKARVTASKVKPIAIMYVLDESGSMEVVKEATVSGFNEYLKGIQKSPTAKQDRITLVTFNSQQGNNHRVHGTVASVNDLTSRSFVPAGMTPLYDAVDHGITFMENDEKTHDIFFVIHTDGQENYSRNTTAEKLKARIGDKQNSGWKFIFLGAGQDAWIAAAAINIQHCNTMSYDNTDRGTARAFKTASIGTYHFGISDNQERKGYTLSDAAIDTRGQD